MKTILIFLCFSLVLGSVQAQDYKGSASASTIEQKLNDDYCSGLFQSTHGDILDVASSQSAQGYLNILDWLQGRVSGLQIYQTRMGGPIPVIRGGVPAIYLDEMQVSAATLNTINTRDIAIIKIIKTPFLGGFNSGHGAIAIYTLGEEDEDVDSK